MEQGVIKEQDSGFIYAGCGYGGSCFPKDVNALNRIAVDAGYRPKIIPAVEEVNREQKLELVNMIKERFGDSLKGLSLLFGDSVLNLKQMI